MFGGLVGENEAEKEKEKQERRLRIRKALEWLDNNGYEIHFYSYDSPGIQNKIIELLCMVDESGAFSIFTEHPDFLSTGEFLQNFFIRNNPQDSFFRFENAIKALLEFQKEYRDKNLNVKDNSLIAGIKSKEATATRWMTATDMSALLIKTIQLRRYEWQSGELAEMHVGEHLGRKFLIKCSGVSDDTAQQDLEKAWDEARKYGLKSGETIYFPHSNYGHWTVYEFKYDSAGAVPNFKSGGTHIDSYKPDDRRIIRQSDGYSCGDFTWLRIASQVTDDKHVKDFYELKPKGPKDRKKLGGALREYTINLLTSSLALEVREEKDMAQSLPLKPKLKLKKPAKDSVKQFVAATRVQKENTRNLKQLNQSALTADQLNELSLLAGLEEEAAPIPQAAPLPPVAQASVREASRVVPISGQAPPQSPSALSVAASPIKKYKQLINTLKIDETVKKELKRYLEAYEKSDEKVLRDFAYLSDLMSVYSSKTDAETLAYFESAIKVRKAFLELCDLGFDREELLHAIYDDIYSSENIELLSRIKINSIPKDISKQVNVEQFFDSKRPELAPGGKDGIFDKIRSRFANDKELKSTWMNVDDIWLVLSKCLHLEGTKLPNLKKVKDTNIFLAKPIFYSDDDSQAQDQLEEIWSYLNKKRLTNADVYIPFSTNSVHWCVKKFTITKENSQKVPDFSEEGETFNPLDKHQKGDGSKCGDWCVAHMVSEIHKSSKGNAVKTNKNTEIMFQEMIRPSGQKGLFSKQEYEQIDSDNLRQATVSILKNALNILTNALSNEEKLEVKIGSIPLTPPISSAVPKLNAQLPKPLAAAPAQLKPSSQQPVSIKGNLIISAAAPQPQSPQPLPSAAFASSAGRLEKQERPSIILPPLNILSPTKSEEEPLEKRRQGFSMEDEASSESVSRDDHLPERSPLLSPAAQPSKNWSKIIGKQVATGVSQVGAKALEGMEYVFNQTVKEFINLTKWMEKVPPHAFAELIDQKRGELKSYGCKPAGEAGLNFVFHPLGKVSLKSGVDENRFGYGIYTISKDGEMPPLKAYFLGYAVKNKFHLECYFKDDLMSDKQLYKWAMVTCLLLYSQTPEKLRQFIPLRLTGMSDRQMQAIALFCQIMGYTAPVNTKTGEVIKVVDSSLDENKFREVIIQVVAKDKRFREVMKDKIKDKVDDHGGAKGMLSATVDDGADEAPVSGAPSPSGTSSGSSFSPR